MKLRRPIPSRGGNEFEAFCRHCRRKKRGRTKSAGLSQAAKRSYWKRARRLPVEVEP